LKRDTINYFFVGIFVLAVLVCFLFTLYKITGRSGPVDNYYVSYKSVTGIQFGTPVLFEGYQIGQVKGIEPLFEEEYTHYRLTIAVTRGWNIRKNSIATVEASGLLSAVSININEGTDSEMLTPGAYIQGQEAENIFAAVNNIAQEIRDLIRLRLGPLVDNMDDQVSLVSGDFRELTSDKIEPLIDNQLTALLNSLNESADGLQNILSENNQEYINQILIKLNAAATDTNKLLIDLQASKGDLVTLLDSLDKIVGENEEDIRLAVMDLRKSLHIISQNIELVTHNIERTSRNMNEFSRQIRENPGSLLRNSPQSNADGVE